MELKPCPFCGVKLMHISGKRVNRYYKGEPTLYEHSQKDSCVLGKYGRTIIIRENDIESWNKRVTDETERKVD